MPCIHALQLVAREGIPCNINNVPFDGASIYKTHALIKAPSYDIDMAHVVYHLQDNDDPSNIVLINDAEAALTVDHTKKIDDYLGDVVSMIDSTFDYMEKNDGDLSNVISIINSTVNDTKKSDDDLGDVVSMIDSTFNNMKNDNDLSNIVLIINSTANDMKKNDDNSNNIVLMISAYAASTQNSDDSSNIISMINADAALTQNNEDSNREMTVIEGVSYDDNYIGTCATLPQTSSSFSRLFDIPTACLQQLIVLSNCFPNMFLLPMMIMLLLCISASIIFLMFTLCSP